jgi:histidyl-tRNA synthetase
LVDYFRDRAGELSDDSRDRLERNPLRILDSKDPRDRPSPTRAGDRQFPDAEARDFFAQVRRGLDAAGVQWTRNARLVRGLDYYRHTAFEFVTDRLGAQGAVIAGGRYDGLIETLGGPHTPAVGWAAGIERLAMLIDAPEPEAPFIGVVADDPRVSSRGASHRRAPAAERACVRVSCTWEREKAQGRSGQKGGREGRSFRQERRTPERRVNFSQSRGRRRRRKVAHKNPWSTPRAIRSALGRRSVGRL